MHSFGTMEVPPSLKLGSDNTILIFRQGREQRKCYEPSLSTQAHCWGLLEFVKLILVVMSKARLLHSF